MPCHLIRSELSRCSPPISLVELPQGSGPRPRDVKTWRRACNCGWSRASLVEVPDSRVGEMVVGAGLGGVGGVRRVVVDVRVKNAFRVTFLLQNLGTGQRPIVVWLRLCDVCRLWAKKLKKTASAILPLPPPTQLDPDPCLCLSAAHSELDTEHRLPAGPMSKTRPI